MARVGGVMNKSDLDGCCGAASGADVYDSPFGDNHHF